ncbi:MAG: hypothetical protein GY937_18825 [bacterium]|nr:hypothetical protein [bacterium]
MAPVLARAFACLLLLLVAAGAQAQTEVRLSGAGQVDNVAPDANGRFVFPGKLLRKNAINTFAVTAEDAAGNVRTEEISIAQLSLANIVVSQIVAEPLPPERIEQLVADGTIDLEDPENYNVSIFTIVLTIEKEPVVFEVPVARRINEPEGFETFEIPKGRFGGGGEPRVPDAIIFEFQPGGTAGGELVPAIPGVILIEGRIKTLKEFFSVRLMLMNTSGIFTLSDVTGMIRLPEEGLSNTLPKDGLVRFGDIDPGEPSAPGQVEREFIVRGDEIGEWPVSVEFGGFVTGPGIPEDAPIPFNGSAETSLEVLGPPEMRVQVSHPDFVEAFEPYDLTVRITNVSEQPALYPSLELDVGAAAELLNCSVDEAGDPFCEVETGSQIREFAHLFPGESVTEVFRVLPFDSGPIGSCTAGADQNLKLEVFVGNLGCLVGSFPPRRADPEGRPSVRVIPTPGLLGVSDQAPVTLFFSELMALDSINSSSLKVLDAEGEEIRGQIQTTVLNDRTVAIWQVNDGITNRLPGNEEITVIVSDDIRDLDGFNLANGWQSTFTTTDPNNDITPPTITVDIEPPTDPLAVSPGEILQINAYPQDQGSRVARVEIRLRDENTEGAAFELIDQKTVFDSTTLPCIFAIDTTTLNPGNTYQAKATAYDGAGNLQDATVGFILGNAPILPSIVLPDDPADPVAQGITLTLAPDAVGPTVRDVAYFLDGAPDPIATVFLPPYQVAIPTTELTVGPHTLEAVASDGNGDTASDSLGFVVAVNPTRPDVSFAIGDGASFVQGFPFAVNADITDSVGIVSIEFYLDGDTANPISIGSEPFVIDTTGLAPGPHTVSVLATNALGATNLLVDPASILDFVVLAIPPNGAPPPAPVVTSLTLPVDDGTGETQTEISGTSVPGARIQVTNTNQGTSAVVFADVTGVWSATLVANPDDALEIVAFDLTQSPDASVPAAAVVPSPPTLLSMSITPGALNFGEIGAFSDVSVIAAFDDASFVDVTDMASYSSNDVGVAGVSTTGRVLATGKGAAIVTATYQGLQGTTNVVVDFASLDAITVTPSSVMFDTLGATQPLVVEGVFSDGSTGPVGVPVSFFGSAPAVVSVDSAGVVTAIGGGNATVFVSAGALIPVAVPVSVVANDPAPTVTILSPPDGSDIEPGNLVDFMVQGDDLGGGVAQLIATASGQASFSQTLQIQPPLNSAPATFNVPIPVGATVGGQVLFSVQAVDTNGTSSPVASITLNVTDLTRPQATIVAPAPDTPFNFGDTIQLQVDATDAVGVTELRYDVTGAFTDSGSQLIAPSQTSASFTFGIPVPFGLTSPDVLITAQALDGQGNIGTATALPVRITSADITPPDTIVTNVNAPSGTSVTVDYLVQAGLGDLDHVELFFRRDGFGTFNRYTDSTGGNANGEYLPQAGASGSIVFDSTRMGGDGSYEFATVGVDTAGNREPLPDDGLGNPVGDLGATAAITAGTIFTVLNTDTLIVAGALDGQNVRVDAARVTFAGTHLLQNLELVNGAVVDHLPADAVSTDQLDLSVWTLTIDATSVIDASGLGYLGGKLPDESGQTAGNLPGSEARQGGSYGGLGGNETSNGLNPAPVYGDLTEPLLPGGGGGASGNTDGGDGGGLVLLGAINLVVDGAIRADGGIGAGGLSGMGAGGGINLRTRTLSGTGTVEADGGTRANVNNVGGGGGRIALRFLDISTYDPQLITSSGGDGFYADGADGTIFLLEEGTTVGDLVINGNGPGSPLTNLLIPPGATFDTIILQNGANVVADGAIQLAEDLILRGGSSLTHADGDESCLVIDSSRVEIDATSAIDVTGRGYAGGIAAGASGETLAGQLGAGPRVGGSYGGDGGSDGSGGARSPLYGDPSQPTLLGSGGGASGNTDGGAGGGCVRMIVSNEVVVDGAIRANGSIGAGGLSGMGSGGSVWISTSRLAGAGVIQTDGGDRSAINNFGGGGGRIALEVDFVDPQSDLGGLRQVTARGGDGFYADGAPGTVFIHRTGDIDGELIVDAGLATGTWPLESRWVPVGPGIASAVGPDTLTTDGAVPLLPGGLVGLRLNPDTLHNETFEIADNTATTISVVTPNENGFGFPSLASPGNTYAGHWRFDRVTLQGGAFVEIADPVTVNDVFEVNERSTLTHPQTSQIYEARLDLSVDALHVDATSQIDVSARGYEGGRLLDEPGFTLGNVAGSATRTGGSHGGLGGAEVNAGGPPNPTYGSLTDPQDLGSGGGANGNSDGGDGGGRIFVTATNVTVDGTLNANGGIGAGGLSGMGAGGSINLVVDLLGGTGTISADGGTRADVNNVGGGGGRVAIQHIQPIALPVADITARGGDGFYADGGPGTVFLRGSSQLFGDLLIDGQGFVNPPDLAILPGNLTFDDITLRGGAQVLAQGPIQATGSLRIEGSSVLTHPARDESCLQVSAASLDIEAGSAIDVTSRGYSGGTATGAFGETLAGQVGAGTQTGGSHGGPGGVASGATGSPVPVYGDPKRPALLGSGGGSNGNTDGGDGGGCVRIQTTVDVIVDGAIRANGSIGAGGLSGMGAGGSVWITTGRLAGTGVIQADGGDRSNVNNVGGGGGRIALEVDFVDPASDLGGLRQVTARGGDGFYADGAPGSVYLHQTGDLDGELIVDAGLATGTWPTAASWVPIGPGVAAGVGPDTLLTDGGVLILPGGLAGMRLNPDVAQSETFQIGGNTASVITVVTPNENGVDFATVASAGATYAGTWRFDRVTLQGGAFVEIADPVIANDRIDITEGSWLTHPETTQSYEASLDLVTGGFSIDATARGYEGGRATGASGFTLGNLPGSGTQSGGSYGGLGGQNGTAGGPPNPLYGDPNDPRDLGSGGGSSGSTDGGDGGGRVFVTATDLVVDGAIRADGGIGAGGLSGMGSGGSVNLVVDTLGGSGTISAGGGDRSNVLNVGGGGGRVSIVNVQPRTLPAANITAPGGDGFYADGQDGTVSLQGP